MIALPVQIGLALLLDAFLGDPRRLPHPVRGIGWLAQTLEKLMRPRITNERASGFLTSVIVIVFVAMACWALLYMSRAVHSLLGDLVSIAILYFSFAARDLSRHAIDVKEALAADDLDRAREKVGLLVGRDTDGLDAAEVSRAAVESVAENTVDAVTAPLLFAFIAGPVGAMVYKAINTLDSTFGYQNERYLLFGWFAAKLDDWVNFVPARLTALMTPLAAAMLNLDARQSWAVFLRDRHNHPSPNGGQIEAAMAGALNVRLGGYNSYFGEKSFRPFMGDNNRELCNERIGETVMLMWTVSLLMSVFGLMLFGALGTMA